MKAMHLTSPHVIESSPLLLTDTVIPTPDEDEILLNISACGICHTDLHVIEGELSPKKLPLIPGHQVVGTVEKVGSRVKNFSIGNRAGVAWLHWTCGDCGYCKRGKENLCPHAKFTGYDVDGGYAEYMVVPADFAYSIPKQLTDEEAAPLLCAGIIGYRALRLSEIKPGQRLGLFGFGASAHIAIQVAKYWNCEVFVFSRSVHHQKLAEQLGATWTGTAEEIPSHRLQSAIIFAPAGELVPKALRTLDKGGILALAGIHMTPIPSLDYSLLYHERTIRSVANSTRQDGVEFLKLAAEIPIRTEVEVFPLREANRSLQLLKAGKIRGAGVLQV
ncbi:MAG: zinc-dependent alcohol dehydrogenase family protein [Ignavibacteriae bacterium]|nr:zinc-dependent alcohol dehydrogenase family protein [Ignavibacteriota bacterium]